MGKVCVPLSCWNYGDMLAEDVNNEKGITLAAKGTIINQYIKAKLIELHIEYLWLCHSEEEMSNQNYLTKNDEIIRDYKEVILLEKHLINELSSGGRIDYQDVNVISDVVYKNVNESNQIAKCLMEIKAMDEYTYTHSVNVSFYAMLIAKWLNLSPGIIKEVIQAGLLHDIGK